MAFFPAGLTTFTLQSSVSSTQTTITLSSFKVPVSGDNVTMALMNTTIAYATIAPRTNSSEFISFTGITQNADGTATLTGVVRGLNKTYPYTTDNDFKLPHAGASQFILSDAPGLFNEYSVIQNDETITGLKTFTQLPLSNGGNATTGTQLITYAQALALATGTANINRIVVAGNAGETVTTGQLLYLLVSDGEWYKCDADTAAQVDNVILGIAQGAGTNGNAIANGILLFGLDSNQTGLTDNTAYYASNTAGAISSTPGTVEVSVGISRSTTSILFYPRYNQQLTEDQQDALVGTVGTPSATNKYVTNDDTSGTGAIARSSLLPTSLLVNYTTGESISASQPLSYSLYTQNDLPITFDANASNTFTSGSTNTLSLTIGNNSNRLLVVDIEVPSGSAVTAVTYNSIAMALIDSQTLPNAANIQYSYRLIAPTVGTANISVTTSGSIAGGMNVIGTAYYNVDQTTPIEANNKTTTSSGGSFSLAISTLTGGAIVHSGYAFNASTGTAGITFSSIAGLNLVNVSFALGSAKANSPIVETAQSVTVTNSHTDSNNRGVINLAIKPSQAQAAGVVKASATAGTVFTQARQDFVGFSTVSAVAGVSTPVLTGGIVTGLSGLTIGKYYYLQNTAGTIGLSPGTVTRIVCKALSSTTAIIYI